MAVGHTLSAGRTEHQNGAKTNHVARRTITIAHLSDPHLPIDPAPKWLTLVNKRLLGFINWQTKRRHVHQRSVLDLLTADIHAHKPDQILVGGDLVNLALPDEFSCAEQWLQDLGTPEKIMLVPGNHDTYVPVAWAKGLGRFADYMAGERNGDYRVPSGFDDFPFVRAIGPVRIIGVNTAPSTLPGMASGRIDVRQQDKLDAILQSPPATSPPFLSFVLCHHPVMNGLVPWHKSLRGGAAVIESLGQTANIIVLHGHAHVPLYRTFGAANTPHIGVASASYEALEKPAQPDEKRNAGQYHLFHITPCDDGFDIALTVRAVDPDCGKVYTVRQCPPAQWPPDEDWS